MVYRYGIQSHTRKTILLSSFPASMQSLCSLYSTEHDTVLLYYVRSFSKEQNISQNSELTLYFFGRIVSVLDCADSIYTSLRGTYLYFFGRIVSVHLWADRICISKGMAGLLCGLDIKYKYNVHFRSHRHQHSSFLHTEWQLPLSGV
jgi:hypothetical protein